MSTFLTQPVCKYMRRCGSWLWVGFFPLVEGFERASTVWLVPGISAFHRSIGSQQESYGGEGCCGVGDLRGHLCDSPVLGKLNGNSEERFQKEPRIRIRISSLLI